MKRTVSAQALACACVLGVAAAAAAQSPVRDAVSDADALFALQRETPTEATVREDRRVRARLEDRERASWVCYGIGTAALIGAIVLWVTAEPEADARVTPLGGANGGALTLAF